MDPLAHTLVGAALGRAVAGRDVPAAGWIGAIAANAPDWSELVLKPDLWPPRAGGEYLVFHRGITHSFVGAAVEEDRKSTRLNSSHGYISYAVFCLKKKKEITDSGPYAAHSTHSSMH